MECGIENGRRGFVADGRRWDANPLPVHGDEAIDNALNGAEIIFPENAALSAEGQNVAVGDRPADEMQFGQPRRGQRNKRSVPIYKVLVREEKFPVVLTDDDGHSAHFQRFVQSQLNVDRHYIGQEDQNEGGLF